MKTHILVSKIQAIWHSRPKCNSSDKITIVIYPYSIMKYITDKQIEITQITSLFIFPLLNG